MILYYTMWRRWCWWCCWRWCWWWYWWWCWWWRCGAAGGAGGGGGVVDVVAVVVGGGGVVDVVAVVVGGGGVVDVVAVVVGVLVIVVVAAVAVAGFLHLIFWCLFNFFLMPHPLILGPYKKGSYYLILNQGPLFPETPLFLWAEMIRLVILARFEKTHLRVPEARVFLVLQGAYLV